MADRPEEEAASSRAVTPTIEEEPGQSGIIDMASVLFVFFVFQFCRFSPPINVMLN